MFETLESRRLMAFTLNGGILIIGGSDADDRIVVKDRGPELVVVENGQRHAFPAKTVGRIEVRGGAGNDRLDARQATRTRLVMSMGGDSGNDVLFAAPGRTVAHGGEGRDRLVGLGAGDFLDGGRGRDRLEAGDGGGSMYGGRGADTLVGNASRDTIYTGAENARRADGAIDLASGGDGDDDLLIFDDAGDTHDGFEDVRPFLFTANPSAENISAKVDGSTAKVSVRLPDTAWFIRVGEPRGRGTSFASSCWRIARRGAASRRSRHARNRSILAMISRAPTRWRSSGTAGRSSSRRASRSDARCHVRFSEDGAPTTGGLAALAVA